MKILYQLTSPMEKTLGVGEMDRRLGVLRQFAGPETEVAIAPGADARLGSEVTTHRTHRVDVKPARVPTHRAREPWLRNSASRHPPVIILRR